MPPKAGIDFQRNVVAPADLDFWSDGRVLPVPVEQGRTCGFRMITHDFQQIAVRKNLSSGCGRTGLCSRYASIHFVYRGTPRGSYVVPSTRDSTRYVHKVENKHRPPAILDLWCYVPDNRPRSDISSSRRETVAFLRDNAVHVTITVEPCNCSMGVKHTPSTSLDPNPAAGSLS